MEWWGRDRQAAFVDPRGHAHLERVSGGQPPPAGDLTAGLFRGNARCGVKPNGWTAGARWERERDIPDDVYFRALEAQ